MMLFMRDQEKRNEGEKIGLKKGITKGRKEGRKKERSELLAAMTSLLKDTGAMNSGDALNFQNLLVSKLPLLQ